MVACSRLTGCSKTCYLCLAFVPCNTWSSGDTALCRVGSAANQLDLPSLTASSVAGCGQPATGIGNFPLGYFSNITVSS